MVYIKTYHKVYPIVGKCFLLTKLHSLIIKCYACKLPNQHIVLRTQFPVNSDEYHKHGFTLC